MTMHEEIDRFAAQVVVTDPITNLISVAAHWKSRRCSPPD